MVGKPKSAEMHPGPGFRIRTDVERPSAETVAAFHAFDTPAISSSMRSAYGRIASMRIWARRRRAEATSSIARVTFRVFVIERTRRFRSCVVATF